MSEDKFIYVLLVIIIGLLGKMLWDYCFKEPRMPERNSDSNYNPNLDRLVSRIRQLEKELKDTNEEKRNIVVQYNQLCEAYKDVCLKLKLLEQKKRDLTYENNKDNSFVSNEPTENTQKNESNDRVETSVEETMYAAFPRTADGRCYFADLSKNRKEDSYFEFKISSDKKATFKPLDFKKIRNFDSAMNAMTTEGAKSNIATVVQRIEPGVAHLEDKYWIIDKRAIINLV